MLVLLLVFSNMRLTWLLLFLFFSEYGAVPLLMSVTRRIKFFEDYDTTNETSLTSTAHHVIALDYHLARGEVYFTEATGQIYRSRLQSGERVDPTVIAEVKVSDGVAVDWLHDNLYWTDVGRHTLEVATLDGLYRKVLFNATHGLEKPRAIVLDPSRGLMFWSDWGDKARIESSGLDGQKKKTVVSSNVYWPNGLTLDLSNSKLYILDGFLSTISSCNYDGSNLKVLRRSQENFLQAFGLTFYANTLYWNSWRSRSLFRMNTITLQTETLLRQTGLLGISERMMGLKAMHASLQPKSSAPDPCQIATCSHRCLVSQDLTPTCFCPFGYKLSNDNKTCTEEGYLMVSWRRTIRRYTMDGIEDESLIDTTKAVISISYHLQKSLVFWSDIEEHRIYSAPLDQLNNKTVVATPETCDGLAVDWIHDVLYWTDTDRNTLEAAQLDGSKHMIIFDKDLDQPRDVAIDPFSGLLFWSDWGTIPKIERSTLDGSERQTIIDDNHVWPNGITIDIPLKKIYYVDGKLGTIYASSYDGSDRKIIFVPPALTTLQLFSITLLNDELYWTDWHTRTLYRSAKDEIEVAKSIATSSIILLRPNGVKAVHSSLQKTKDNPCAAARCQNLCLGTKSHTAHCMGEEIPDIDVRIDPNTLPTSLDYHPELTKTVSNDSLDISLTKTLTPETAVVTVKCLGRKGCVEDSRCSEQPMQAYMLENQTSIHISGLLPGSHYKINFMSAKVHESFNITTLVNDPPEIPKITSVEKQGKKVTVKWNPVDTCVPGFKSYNYSLYKTAVENNVAQEGSTNHTEVIFDNLEAEVAYTVHVYTYDPKHFSSISFNVETDLPPECQHQNLLCNGKEDCPDGSDEDLKHCAGIENIMVYKKSKSEVYFRIDVTNGTEKQLERFVGSYSSEKANTTGQFESAAEPCVMWPESYCLHVSALQRNTVYVFKIAAALKRGKVGNKFNVTEITKEEVSGPPEDVRVIKHNSTVLMYQWHHPNKSNGIINNFIINIEETETFEEDKCCQSFPIIEMAVSAEESYYESATTGLTPASSYAISIAARNVYIGRTAAIVVNTPPPPMEIIRMPRVEVASLLPLSWQPGEEPGELPQYHTLIRSYMLLLLPPKNEPLNDAGNNELDAVKELLQSNIGDRFIVLWDKKVEDTAAFQSPIKVEHLAGGKRYKLAWVQVSQYKDSFSIDFLVSDPFIAL